MKKADIKNIIKFNGDDEDIKAAVKSILDKMMAISPKADLGILASVKHFNENKRFEFFNYPDSRNILQEQKVRTKQRILSDLHGIEIDLETWVEKNIVAKGKSIALKLDKSEQPEAQTEKGEKHPVSVKFIDFIPVILGLIVSGIALSLGLTIFNDNQDATYFIAETIKDVLGGIASGFFANQCIVFCKKTEKTSHITLVGGLICSICACVFSFILWILSNYAFVERFTHWDKVTYLWICLSLLFISVISIGLIVWFLIGSSKQKKKTESKQ